MQGPSDWVRDPPRHLSPVLFCILCAAWRVFVLVIHAVIGYLVLVVIFYLQVLGQLMLEALFAGLFDVVFRRKKTRKTSLLADRPDSSVTRPLKAHKSEPSSVVGAIDGRPVLLEISFGEGFHHHRTAIAWVDKPRVGQPLPTVTFVISPPDDDRGGETYLIQVPDEQLGDFKEVENRKRVYRLTSVLYVHVSESEEILI
jgi:hypothetical protein